MTPRLLRRCVVACSTLVGIMIVAAPLGAYVFLFSNAPRWRSSTIVMNLEMGSSGGPLSDGCADWGQCAENALALWNPYLNGTQFSVVRNSTVARINGDGVNVVFSAPNVYGQAFGDRTLAVTIVWARGTSLTDADVIFNTAMPFNSYRGPRSPNGAYDFRRVAAHEFGHVLGLTHPDTAGQTAVALMNSTVSNVEVPQSDDVNGIAALYGGIVTPPTGPPIVVNFPPRNESLEFRNQLEAKYRDGLRAALSSTYVDVEGSVVWMQEYLKYRVNQCSHQDAITRVFMQIDGFGVQPVCGIATGTQVNFPARDQSLNFGSQLETKYRDSLKRSAGNTFVNIEGNAVWTQEYLRLRVNGCTNANATSSVFSQIGGTTPICR